ncbi:MAG TPA: PorP/SprF family type IX secretion system membrane protein, partial [Saprospiraceae bacterium]|nr:PorP/SprF family type IX secretion system membrane protein [Saprospiraceae bacterium]
MIQRNLILLTVLTGLSLLATPLRGQQDGQYTQFMFNRLYYTPGFAGSEGGPCLSLLYRKQWIGLEGSPEAQLISFNTPLFQQRVGLGVNLYRTSIGITRNVTAEMAYSYRIPLGQGYLGIGLSGSVRYYAEDYSDERLKGTQD